MDMNESITHRKWKITLAMGCVYLFWGGTYLGMKIALEGIPPFLMAGSRFILAGLLLYVFARMTGAKHPKLKEWIGSGSVGALLLLGGNGGICWAEQYVPSSLAALLVATMPFWITLFNWLIWKGKRPNRFVVAGLMAGFAGIALISLTTKHVNGNTNPLLPNSQTGAVWYAVGIIVCLLAAISWSFGSTWSRFAKQSSSPIMATATQQLVGGSLLFVMAGITGDFSRFDQIEGTQFEG